MTYEEFKTQDNALMQEMHDLKMTHIARVIEETDTHKKILLDEEFRHKEAVRKEEQDYRDKNFQLEVQRREIRFERTKCYEAEMLAQAAKEM